jgi:hypothetical protein
MHRILHGAYADDGVHERVEVPMQHERATTDETDALPPK